MKIKNYSYFCFGSCFFTKLQPLLQERGSLTGSMLGVSPLSELSASVKTENDTLVYWLSELDSKLEASNADYFLLNLQNVLQPLLNTGGSFVSASKENLKLLTRKEISIVDPILLDKAVIDKALDSLINVIKKHFASNQIILIHTTSSPYWLLGNNLRVDNPPAPDTKHIQWLGDLEQLFCDKADCRFIDVTRFYFYQKEVGKPLTDETFEKECYIDTANSIFSIAEGGDGKSARPDFALSLDRYVAYYFTLQRKPQRIFLNADYFLDKLVLSSNADFVKKYRQELITLDALDWNNVEKAIKTLQEFKPDSTLTKVCIAFNAVINDQYTEGNVDYALMFRCEIVPDELIAYLKKEYAPQAGLLPTQINRYNAGYHFAMMTENNPYDYSTKGTVAYPTVIDVFGSCISRTIFNVQDNDFAINRYWFHVPPFEYRNKPVEYKSSLFPAKLSWTDRLVKLQFENGIYQDIENSESKWLLLDLYFLVSPNNFYYKEKDCFYGDFDHRVSNLLRAQRVNLLLNPNFFGTVEDLFHAMDSWINIIKKKYGNKIILVTGYRTDYWIGDDDRIYQQPANHDPCNKLLNKASGYIRDKLDCYMLDIGKYFLPDDLGYMRNTPVHKEDACYFAEHNISRYIVDNMPEQKVFSQYDGQNHMAHLERLVKNNSLELLEKALPLSELDKAILKLGYDEMINKHNELAELYDKCNWNASLDDIVDSLDSKELSKALRKVAKIASKESTADEFPLDYKSDAVQFINNFNLPKVILKQIKNNRGFVSIRWNAPVDTSVRIYRSSDKSTWEKIGTSTNGSFLDKSAEPSTEYQYSLCAEITENGRVFLANFTQPVLLHTAVATPVLISAVNFAGENTLRWSAVAGAESYLVYHKDKQEDTWQLCATIDADTELCFKEPSKFQFGGEWYTVRALCKVNGADEAGGFQPGISALPL